MKNLFFVIFFVTSAHADIIFETDFSKDVGYSISASNLFNTDNVPDGWDGVKASAASKVSVVENQGIGGKPALKLEWDPNFAQPTISLLKHLTGDPNTGYRELYIRYNVRLPDNFKLGDGVSSLPYWKWGRLWQNTGVDAASWTENREDSFYFVWTFAGSPFFGVLHSITVGANEGVNLRFSSSGGESYRVRWFTGEGGLSYDFAGQGGYFQAVGDGAWDVDWLDFTSPGFLKTRAAAISQTYHTIEYRFKLASSTTANDGVIEIWYDGVKQSDWTELDHQQGAAPLPANAGIPTAVHGSGFNCLVLFDNMVEFNKHWGQPEVDGFIYVNDIVVSDHYIGHDYVVGQSSPPLNLRK
jgi:hypothetical protein